MSVLSVFARDFPLNQEAKITGKLSIDKGSVFINFSDGENALVDGKPATMAALKKQVGKVVTLHGVMNKMDGTGRTKYGTELIFGLDDSEGLVTPPSKL
jgi:ribosomal protein S4E